LGTLLNDAMFSWELFTQCEVYCQQNEGDILDTGYWMQDGAPEQKKPSKIMKSFQNPVSTMR